MKLGSIIILEWNCSEIFFIFGNVVMLVDFYIVLENWRRNGLWLNFFCGCIYVYCIVFFFFNLNCILLVVGKLLIGKIKGFVSK